jgi:hypothetical protein
MDTHVLQLRVIWKVLPENVKPIIECFLSHWIQVIGVKKKLGWRLLQDLMAEPS